MSIIELLDTYEAARNTTNQLLARAYVSDAAGAACVIAQCDEDAAADACILEIRKQNPEMSYTEARGRVVVPAYRERLRAQCATQNE